MKPKLKQDIVRFKRGIGCQIAAPIALRSLFSFKSVAGFADGNIGFLMDILRCDRDGFSRTGWLNPFHAHNITRDQSIVVFIFLNAISGYIRS